MAPIFLNRTRATQSADDAGVLIIKSKLPRYNPGPYTPQVLPDDLKPLGTLRYVPPLAHFCIKSLLQNVDLIDMGSTPRVPYHPKSHTDLLTGLIPSFESQTRQEDLKYVDPRVWGTLIQIYASLPTCFATYALPLSDTHLTQLQAIRSTPDFTLVTVLELASRPELSDETVGALKPLTNLCVLDLSGTRIGSWGVRQLSMCLAGSSMEGRGPWALRVWSLRACVKVDDTAKDALAKFPLLSVVDLRETSVTPASCLSGFSSRPPSTHDFFYYPSPPLSWIPALGELFPRCRLFESSSQPYFLHVNRPEHPKSTPSHGTRTTISTLLHGRLHRRGGQMSSIGEQDRVVALLPDGTQTLHTEHGLAQAAERELAQRKMMEPVRRQGGWFRPREKLEHMDRYPHFYGETNSDASMEEASDGGGFDLRDMGGGFGSHDSEAESDTWDQQAETNQQNDIAAVVASRHNAEREAHGFYGRGSFPGREGALRLRGRTLAASVPPAGPARRRHISRISQQLPGEELSLHTLPGTSAGPPRRRHISRISQQPLDNELSSDTPPGSPAGRRPARKPCLSLREDGGERSLMFFRTPLAFDAKAEAGECLGPVRRKNLDAVISVKRRKTAPTACRPPKALLNRLGTAGGDEQRKRGGTGILGDGLSKRPLSFRKVPQGPSPVPSGSTKHGISPSVSGSMNPFLAKKKLHSQHQMPTIAATPGIPFASSQHSSTPLSIASPNYALKLPAMFAAVTNKSSSKAESTKQNLLSKSEAAQSRSMTEEKQGRSLRETRGTSGFDLKAWATKAKE